jgi:hypothetical protein
MALIRMRMLPEAGDREDVLVNTDAIQIVSPFGDRVVLVVLDRGDVIRCEGTIDDLLALVDAESK